MKPSMKLKLIISAAILSIQPAFAFAQQADPMESANAIDACNGSEVVSAVWLPDGRLGVTCPRGAVSNTGGGGGGGATNFALPALIALALGAAALGGSSSTSGTTN